MGDFFLGFGVALAVVASCWVAREHAKGFRDAIRAVPVRCGYCRFKGHSRQAVITGDGSRICFNCIANTDAGDWEAVNVQK